MIVVSDTTPLRYLIEIEEADLLAKLFVTVAIPEKVAEELQHPKTPPAVKAWMLAAPSWLVVRPAQLTLFSPKLKIQAGEHEAIALALELKADLLLLDDQAALKEAARLNLPSLRILRILEEAAKQGWVDLPTVITNLSQTNFHMPPTNRVEEMFERDRQRRQSKP